MPTIESYQLLLAAAAACEDKKGEDIRILALDPNESGLCDYFLICNGTNDRQNVAITDEIEIRLKRDHGVYPNSVEGRRQGEWILMDYVDFIVHVFSAEKRAFYGLERLRKTAVTVSVADLSTELKQATTKKISASRQPPTKGPSKKVAKPPTRGGPISKQKTGASKKSAVRSKTLKAAALTKAPKAGLPKAVKAPAVAKAPKAVRKSQERG